ncbi:MAG: hypothetical protein LBH80_08745 [Prevotellaceae bacterium]|jgi:hypothetical protein|nr:hypothetical protein [Prevotellaceae bacterium]
MPKSKNNRKKKKKNPPVRSFGVRLSNSSLDVCYATARRIIKALGEDEALFDVFTKRQKHRMFIVTVMPPHILAMPGHAVPKSFLTYIQYMLISKLKQLYFDEENKVTWMDIATVGEGMMFSFMADGYTSFLQQQQLEVAQRLLAALEKKDIFVSCQEKIKEMVRISLISLSQPNFRTYGMLLPELHPVQNRPVVRNRLYITAHKCQTLRFNYHNYERIAFRFLLPPIGKEPLTNAFFMMSWIFPNVNIKHDRRLDVYIQSHAIHRFKERLDILSPAIRSELLHISLSIIPKVVRGTDGKMYIPCNMPDEKELKAIGYFAFTISGNNLLILTFLPLLSYRVPEGYLLGERLHLSQEDMVYLGMDKLKFFYEVDIEQIPALKRILFDELHLNYLHKANPYYKTTVPFSEKRTAFVKNFFRDVEDY